MGTAGEGLQSVAACEEFFHLLSVESETGRAEAPHQPSRAMSFSGDQQRLDIAKEVTAGGGGGATRVLKHPTAELTADFLPPCGIRNTPANRVDGGPKCQVTAFKDMLTVCDTDHPFEVLSTKTERKCAAGAY
jgi:hypothetical protein